MTLEERIHADAFREPQFREFGEPNYHFSAEDDRGVLVVLGLFVALLVAAFALGFWLRGKVGV